MFYLIKINMNLNKSEVIAANTWYTQILKIKNHWQTTEPHSKYVIVREVINEN